MFLSLKIFNFILCKFLKVSKSQKLIMASWILPKKQTLGQFSVHKIAPAFIFWKNPGQHKFFFSRFSDLQWGRYNALKKFQYCQSAQIQPKSQFLFHKNLPPRDFSIMILGRIVKTVKVANIVLVKQLISKLLSISATAVGLSTFDDSFPQSEACLLCYAGQTVQSLPPYLHTRMIKLYAPLSSQKRNMQTPI